MSERITRADVVAATAWLQKEAHRLEMLPEDAYLVFSPGNTSYCHAPEVSVFLTEPASNGRQTMRVHFLPAFTGKTTRKQAWELINTAARALAAVPTRTYPTAE